MGRESSGGEGKQKGGEAAAADGREYKKEGEGGSTKMKEGEGGREGGG